MVDLYKIQKMNHALTENKIYIAEVTKEPKVSEKSVHLELNLEYFRGENTLNQMTEKVLVYLPIDTNSLQLSLGQRIIFKADFQEIKNMGNPDEFDYQSYMANHQIYNQAFIKANQWKILSIQPKFSLQTKALQIRNHIIRLFQQYGIKDQQLAVLSALSLGYKNKLDEEIKHAYSNSGGMHVLAVSGLHVGIIYFILAFLLKPLNRKRFGKYFSTGIIIIFLWFYAFLTGLSPSVFRAATMFSIIATGTLFKKNTNIYNSLAASAFILLLFNPFLITEIGFQLSYLAVIGIVYFHPKIYKWFSFNNILADKIWSLTAVSLAAQIATAPISLYYFGQFPVYFLLTNFIVIPFATILIYGTILFLLFSFIHPIAFILAKTLDWLVAFLNKCILQIENLPGSLITHIEFPPTVLFLCYITIILLAAYFVYQHKKYFFFSFASIIIIIGILNFQKITEANKSHFIVFNVPGNTFAQMKEKSSILNISTINNPGKNYVFNQNTGKGQMEKHIVLNEPDHFLALNKNLFLFGDKIILFPTNWNIFDFNEPGEKLDIDYLIVTKQSQMNLNDLLDYFDVKKIIFDSSVSSYDLIKWEGYCGKNNIPFYSTRSEGAYIYEL